MAGFDGQPFVAGELCRVLVAQQDPPRPRLETSDRAHRRRPVAQVTPLAAAHSATDHRTPIVTRLQRHGVQDPRRRGHLPAVVYRSAWPVAYDPGRPGFDVEHRTRPPVGCVQTTTRSAARVSAGGRRGARGEKRRRRRPANTAQCHAPTSQSVVNIEEPPGRSRRPPTRWPMARRRRVSRLACAPGRCDAEDPTTSRSPQRSLRA